MPTPSPACDPRRAPLPSLPGLRLVGSGVSALRSRAALVSPAAARACNGMVIYIHDEWRRIRTVFVAPTPAAPHPRPVPSPPSRGCAPIEGGERLMVMMDNRRNDRKTRCYQHWMSLSLRVMWKKCHFSVSVV